MTSAVTSLQARLRATGSAAGLSMVGFCSAEPFVGTRHVLEERRDAGLNADMAFTYRNPARSTDPSRTLDGAVSMVVAARSYDTVVPAAPAVSAARVARYAVSDHYAALRSGLEAVRDELRSLGHRGVVVADDNAMVDRAAAVRAGLGWYGKNAMVLLPGQGSWFVLGSVITDADLSPFPEPVQEACGSCTRCLDGCPTAAIVSPGVVDARRCLAWHVQAPGDFPREFRRALGDRIYGCDECQEVCPPSRRTLRIDEAQADSGQPGAAPVDAPGSWVEVSWLLNASDEELLEGVGRWYIARRDPRYLRRNALVVLGNSRHDGSAVAASSEVDAILIHYLDGPDEMLAEHAAWAALELGRGDLVRRASCARRDGVVAELRNREDGDR